MFFLGFLGKEFLFGKKYIECMYGNYIFGIKEVLGYNLIWFGNEIKN